MGSCWRSSPRRTSGCTSWLTAIGVPKPERDFLGRWAVTAMADAYARTAQRVVENLQILAARAAKLVFNGGPDLFGEEEVVEDLRAFLLTRRVPAASIQRQVARLTLASNEKKIPLNLLAKLRADEEVSGEEVWEDVGTAAATAPESLCPPAPFTPGGLRWLEAREKLEAERGCSQEELSAAQNSRDDSATTTLC